MTINLLPWRPALQRTQQRRLLWLAFYSILFALLSWIAWQIKSTVALHQQIAATTHLRQQINALNTKYEHHRALEKMVQVEAQQVDYIKKQIMAYQQTLQLLEQLSEKLPPSVYLITLEKNARLIELRGKASSHTELALLLQRLEKLTVQPQITETTHPNETQMEIDFHLAYTLTS